MIGIDEVIPLTYDRLFKKIMKEQKEYTIRLIHLITGLPEELFMEAFFHDTELINQHYTSKRRVADIFITTDKLIVNLEANRIYSEGVRKRNALYLIEASAQNMKIDDSYSNHHLYIQINFNVSDKEKSLINHYMIKDEENICLTEDIHFYSISLVKLNDKRYTKNINEELVMLLKLMYEKEIKKLEEIGKNSLTREVVEKMKEYSNDKVMLGWYFEDEERAKIEKTILIDTREEAIKEGKEEGQKIGREEGQKIGREEGIKEGIELAQKDMVLRMLKNNVSVEDIHRFTGVSIENIELFKEEL